MILMPVIDLRALIARLGDRGVEIGYRAAGAVIGDLWLHAGALGLGGTACGGTFDGEVRGVTGRHGLDHFAPLSFCLGPCDGNVSSAAAAVRA